MSIEGILLFVFFVVMPLVQQWRERQKKQQPRQAPRRVPPPAEAQTEPRTAPETEILEDDGFEWGRGWEPVDTPPVPPPPPPRPRSAPLPVPAPVLTRPPVVPVPRPVPAMVPVQRTAPTPVVRAARVHRRQSAGAASGLSGCADLRQAIRQMAILGPCRATAPYGTDV